MPALDHAQARELLVNVVQRFFAQRNSPLPGAFVKAQLLAEAQNQGAIFSERELGFRKFIDFVGTVPEIAIQGRSGSDVLLIPVAASELLAAYAAPLPRLRRDFWRAFIEFPVEGTLRLYDPDEDKVFYEDANTQRKGILIDAVPRETQLQWRRIFSEEQPDEIKNELIVALQGEGNSVFNEFARRLREKPAVMRAWNRYSQKQITDYVASWARANQVAEERWVAASRRFTGQRSNEEMPQLKSVSVSQRGQLYNFFDQLPIEDLLELRVPLQWVLKVTRGGDA